MEAGHASIDCEQRRSGQSRPSQRNAEPSVKTGAVGTAGERMVRKTFMVIPDMCGGHRSVRRELLLSEDSGGQPTSSRTGWYSTSLTLHGAAPGDFADEPTRDTLGHVWLAD